MSDPDIVVLAGHAHGVSTDEYVAAVRERLPDYEIAYARTPAERRELVPAATIVTPGAPDEALLDRAEDLRLFAAGGAGVGPDTVRPFVERGITVTNAAGVHGPNIAEHVLGSMLVFARNLHEGWRRQGRREWRHFQAHDLKGSTVTVVGLGAIGRAIVRRLEGFGVETIGARYTPSKGGPTDEVVGLGGEGFEDALTRTDYLAVACPLTDTTEGLIGTGEFDLLPTDAVLVNIGRGPIVDTDALVGAIRSNGIRGAALDVTDPEPLPEEHPLWSFGNVLITPHMSGYTAEYWERLADILARNVERIEETGSYDDLENQVTLTDDGEVVFGG